jgi:hypothetical protein
MAMLSYNIKETKYIPYELVYYKIAYISVSESNIEYLILLFNRLKYAQMVQTARKSNIRED